MNAERALLHDVEPRTAPRTRLFLSAVIRFDRVSAAIRLRDLSADGVQIEGKTLPAVGTAAEIIRGDLHAGGTVMWRDRQCCGLRFDTPLVLDDWMPMRGSGDQQEVDARVAEVKSGTAAPLSASSAPLPQEALRDALPQRMAEELAYVSRLLESLGDDLSAEPLIVMRHAGELQNLDLAMQILGHVAALLVAEHPERAVKAIGMGSLRKRLERATL